MLAVLLVVGGLIPIIHTYDFPLSLLSVDDNVLTGRFSDSVLLSLPPCNYAGENVDLEYMNSNTYTTYVLNKIFKVPNCNKIDLQGTTALSRKLGYQLMNLTSGTEYTIKYKIGNKTSTTLIVTTRTAANYYDTKVDFPGYSAAMVVITVILTLATFVLLISITLSMIMSANED